MVKSEHKTLLLDIEWRPVKAYVWGAWQENIMPEKIIEDGGLLCVGAKWLNERTTHLFSEWEHGHFGMLERIHEMMSEADVIITYNGDKYDLPKLHGEFVLYDMAPVPPVASIDCLKAVKKFGFFMNRLGFVAPFLGLGGKMEHEGMAFWRKVMDGNENAQRRMARYCIKDVKLLEKLYLKIRAHIRNHPHLGKGKTACPSCGSKHTHHRGNRPTRAFLIERLQCQDCGHWFSGSKRGIK